MTSRSTTSRPRIARSLRRPWVAMPLAAMLVVALMAVLRPDSDSSDGAATDAVADDALVEVTTGSIGETVTASGTVEYAQSEDLSFGAAGTVTAVYIESGQPVTAGEVLAVLDSPELEVAVADAEVTVAEAEAELADLESAGGSDARIAAATSSLATAQDRLAAAREALDGATLTAGFDGVVASVDLVVGEELGSNGTSGTTLTGSGTGSGLSSGTLGGTSGGAPGATGAASTTAQIQVVSAGDYVVTVGVDDADLDSLAAGQAATVSLSTAATVVERGPGAGFPGGAPPGGFPGGSGGAVAGGGATGGNGSTDEGESDPSTQGVVSGVDAATGEVVEVGQIADATSGVASYPVTITFHDDNGDLTAGAVVLVDITVSERTDVLLVPAQAVTRDGDATTVVVDRDGARETRTVTIGGSTGMQVEVVDGLEAGERVVVAGVGPANRGGPPDGGGGAFAPPGAEDGE